MTRHDRGRDEHHHEAVVERSGDQLREELLAGQRGGVRLRQLRQDPGRAEQRLDRVVAEERGEQAADRRRSRDLCATAAGTPWAVSPLVSALGSERTGPAIISEKKMPIESELPAFRNVPAMPDAAPRWFAGTLFMIAVRFGAREQAGADAVQAGEQREHRQYSKFTGMSSRPTNVAATSSSPPVGERPRAPNRSESEPETGPAIRKPIVSGSR